jgi:hypothetical protein
MSIARQRISKQAFSTTERLFSVWSMPRGYKGTKTVIELVVVENWVKFCRWQSKAREKMARNGFGRAKKTSPAFYGTRRFITVFTRALHWSLS